MLKVVVFDGGWGGELVANYLSKELKTIQVIRAIDWENAPYDNKTLLEIEKLAEEKLHPYVGKVDLIVLGGYAVSLAMNYLEKRFPQQKFIGMGINYHRILKARNYPSQIAIFVDSLIIETTVCQEIRNDLPYSTIIVPDCSGWEERINAGEMSKEILHAELSDYFRISAPRKSSTKKKQAVRPNNKLKLSISSIRGEAVPLLEELRRSRDSKTEPQPDQNSKTYKKPYNPEAYRPEDLIAPDVVLLLNTHFWEIRNELEELFGYGVRVIDFRQKLLHDTCTALSLRGVDGCRSK